MVFLLVSLFGGLYQVSVIIMLASLATIYVNKAHTLLLVQHASDHSLHSAFIQLVPQSTLLKYGRQCLYFHVRYILNH